MGGAATTINIGNTGGTVNIRSTLTVNGVSVIGFTQGAYDTGNSAFSLANGTAIAANTPSYVANSAAIYANGAFAAANNAANTANTDYTTITITSGSYGNATYVPIVNVAANGRVTGISTTPIVGGGSSANNWYSSNGYFINSNTVTSNITVSSGNNALSVGPLTINNNITTLIQTASRWVIL